MKKSKHGPDFAQEDKKKKKKEKRKEKPHTHQSHGHIPFFFAACIK
jgi:hypothetical protein